jgi:hypothetical protein
MRKPRAAWIGGIVATFGVFACGGQTNGDGASKHDAKDASVGVGGSRPAGGGGSSGVSREASASSGGTPSAGGAPNCALVDCAPITCGPGEEPVTLPGACCPSLCSPATGGSGGASSTGPEIDAGTCPKTPLPGCGSNNWPYCASTWTDAVSWYPTCPEPIGAYLASCGGMHAIVVPGQYVERRFFYDRADRLVGFESVSQGRAHCEAYIGGFQAPSRGCVPLAAPCLDAGAPPPIGSLNGIDAGSFVTWGNGPPDCATGQAAYDAFLVSQIAQFNTCTQDFDCNGIPGLPLLNNPCVQPCGLGFSLHAFNAQISAHLDTFGNVACALCNAGPPEACGPRSYFGTCVSGYCAQGQ